MAVAAGVGLAGCPSEADDSRLVRFRVEVPHQGREPTPQQLVLAAVDAEALGLDDPTIEAEYGSFVLATGLEAEGDERAEYCLREPAVVTPASSGSGSATIPAGSCLTEGEALQAG